MQSKLPDPQAERLFLSERETGLYKNEAEHLYTLENAIAFVEEVANSEWRNKHHAGPFKVKVKDKLVERKEIRDQSAVAFSYANYIILTKAALCKFMLLHEIAHLLNKRSESYFFNMHIATGNRPKKLGESSHGISFARIEVALVHEFMGKEAGEMLEIAFKRNRVRY
jgi:hypothetical protein